MSEIVLYVAQAVIALTYLLTVWEPECLPLFHAANAVGGTVMVVLTLLTVGWVPILGLTLFFTVAGYIGYTKEFMRLWKDPWY